MTAFVALLPVHAGGAQDEVVPAPSDAAYETAAHVRLHLVYQGTAEGGLSRTLRLFGNAGRCEAWYDITEVLEQPPGFGIRDGDRLWLRYTCTTDRAYEPGPAGTVSWGRVGPRPYEAQVWLRPEDITRDSEGIWGIGNIHNWFAPLAAAREDS